MKTSAILVAAGRGTRMGNTTPKAFLPVAGRPLFTYALRTLALTPSVQSLILVVNTDWRATAETALAGERDLAVPVVIAEGGKERQDSVAAGLARVEGADLVIVHDAARPFATVALFTACVEAATEVGAAIAALPANDTVKLATPDRTIQDTIDRSTVWLAQTPQAFRVDLLRQAYDHATRENFVGTDEASLVERLGAPVRLVPGETTNRKVTTPDDLEWAEWYAKERYAPKPASPEARKP
jgi:2-C-methyl-D-erythritol 4-phosphate cytidylyltransferase